MYKFLFNLWIMGRIDETRIANAVTKGVLTQAEADEILATPQLN
jgi:hypothetical protein